MLVSGVTPVPICPLFTSVEGLQEFLDLHGDMPVMIAALDYKMMMPILAVKSISEDPDGYGDQMALLSFDSQNMYLVTSTLPN